MVRQPSWEQESAVSAPAVRPVGCQLTGGLGAPSPRSGIPVKWARAERQSERPIRVPRKRGNARGWEGAALGLRVRGREALVRARRARSTLTRRDNSNEPCSVPRRRVLRGGSMRGTTSWSARTSWQRRGARSRPTRGPPAWLGRRSSTSSSKESRASWPSWRPKGARDATDRVPCGEYASPSQTEASAG